MRRHTGREVNYSLYITGLSTVLCGVAALNTVLTSSNFSILAAVLLLLGYSTSILLRRLGYTARLFELAVAAAAVAVYIQLIGGESAVNFIMPAAAINTPELRLAAMLLWLEVLRSFTLVSDESVVFSSIPSVVLISLASTNNVNSEILATFMVYLVLTALLLAHRPGSAGSQLKNNFRMSLGVVTVAIAIGIAVVVPVRLVCTKAFSAAMPQFMHAKERMTLTGFNDTDYLQIAQGPIRLSDETVMTVKSHIRGSSQPAGAYWRGKTFDQYTGHGWEVSVGYKTCHPETTSVSSQNQEEPDYHFLNPSPAKGTLLEQKITARPFSSREVFAAAEPVEVICRCRRLVRNRFNCWHGIYSPNASINYTVISALPKSDPAILRRASTDYSPEIKTYFLQRVLSTAKVGNLASKITRGINNPYDKVVAIQDYIGRECVYDLDAPPTPRGSDPVDYFLFTSKVGYCDVFASSMVVMCREVGVPARLVTGFATGDYEPQQDQYRVRELDRHAWVEVYFPGSGWVTFDPTESTRTQGEGFMQMMSKRLKQMLVNVFGGSSVVPLAILLLILCLTVAFGSDVRAIRFRRRITGSDRLRASAVSHYTAIRRQLRTNNPHLTPMECVRESELNNEAKAIALEATMLFDEIRYGTRMATAADIDRLKRLHRDLKNQHRPSWRR